MLAGEREGMWVSLSFHACLGPGAACEEMSAPCQLWEEGEENTLACLCQLQVWQRAESCWSCALGREDPCARAHLPLVLPHSSLTRHLKDVPPPSQRCVHQLAGSRDLQTEQFDLKK